MGEIRVFEESHIPEVAALEMKVFHGRREPAGIALQEYFQQIFFQNPWSDEELPCLIYVHKNRIVGFLGVIPRRMVFRDQPVRVAVATQLMVDTEEYRGFAGLEMLRRFFGGPQDLSLTDGATEDAHAVWTAAGARVAQLYSLQWVRVLRPAGHFRSMLISYPALPPAIRGLIRASRPLWAAVDSALSGVPARSLAPPRTEFFSRAAAADELLECARGIASKEPLRPCYDAESFRWLIGQAAAAERHGELRTAVVYDPAGSAAGWYAYYARRGGESTALNVAAVARHFEEVFEAMLQDAWSCGATSVSGQVIPRFLLGFSHRRCAFRYVGNGVLVHSRNPEIVSSILQGDAALSRLDGEWWTRFAVGDWH